MNSSLKITLLSVLLFVSSVSAASGISVKSDQSRKSQDGSATVLSGNVVVDVDKMSQISVSSQNAISTDADVVYEGDVKISVGTTTITTEKAVLIKSTDNFKIKMDLAYLITEK